MLKTNSIRGKSTPKVVPMAHRRAKVHPKHLKWSPEGHLERPWGELGASGYLQKTLKWSPEGHFGLPWGGLGASWGHLRPDICFLSDFKTFLSHFQVQK